MYQNSSAIEKQIVSVEAYKSQAETRICFNADRIVKIDFKPREATMDDHICTSIANEFCGFGGKPFFLIEGGGIIFFCKVGVFSFSLNCPEKQVELVKKQIYPGSVIFEKKFLGFSLITG